MKKSLLVLRNEIITTLIEQPHGAVAIALSLFPLTPPMTMMLRLSVGGVPWWQPLLAAGLLLITAYGMGVNLK